MKTKSYLTLCGVVTVVWVLGLLLVPPFAEAVEGVMLLFLSRNA